ncbi:MAG TPA: polyphenol oxidase family protein [Thermoanaerobaculia bacterium]|nr:polyphenol oxidase family protein [Thermoanaerobaculia bacterium]
MTIRESRLGRIVVPESLPAGIFLFWTTRDFDGHLHGGGAEAIRETIREEFGVETELATCQQTHGALVVRAKGGGSGWCEHAGCDALHTAQRGLALGIKVADCLPLSLVEPAAGVVANIHSGWRGSVAGITEETLRALVSESLITPGLAHGWLGPSIRQCCFEVGQEVIAQFSARAGVDVHVDSSRGVRPHFDLAGFTRDRLREAGIPDSHIHDSGLCTRCEGSIFHSYRRDGAGAGRNLAVIGR